MRGQSGSKHEARCLDGLCQMPFPCRMRPVDHHIVLEDWHPFAGHGRAGEFAGSAVRLEGDTLWCLVAGGMHRAAGV